MGSVTNRSHPQDVRRAMLNVAEISQLFGGIREGGERVSRDYMQWRSHGCWAKDGSIDGHCACLAIPAPERGGLRGPVEDPTVLD
jgi:hypothetical protein